MAVFWNETQGCDKHRGNYSGHCSHCLDLQSQIMERNRQCAAGADRDRHWIATQIGDVEPLGKWVNNANGQRVFVTPAMSEADPIWYGYWRTPTLSDTMDALSASVQRDTEQARRLGGES